MHLELFLIIDIVKAVLLRRMEREAKMVLNDTFLTEIRRMAGFELYHKVGEDFVRYIESLHTLRLATSVFSMAQIALTVFQSNMDTVWALSYNPKFETRLRICWLSELNIEKAEELY